MAPSPQGLGHERAPAFGAVSLPFPTYTPSRTRLMLKLDRLAEKLHDKWDELVEADRQERKAHEPADTSQDPLDILLEPEPDEPETPRSVELMREYQDLLEQWDDAQDLDCSRCGGSGRYGPTHIMGGDCFRCGGSGRDPAKGYQDPPTPTDPAGVLDDMHRT